MKLSNWVSKVRREREYYDRMKEIYVSAESKNCSPEVVDVITNKNKETIIEINKDITRTQCGDVLFQNSGNSKLAINVLLVFANIDVDLGYKQGMLEILAIILIVLMEETTGNKDVDKAFYQSARLSEVGDTGWMKQFLMKLSESHAISLLFFTSFHAVLL